MVTDDRRVRSARLSIIIAAAVLLLTATSICVAQDTSPGSVPTPAGDAHRSAEIHGLGEWFQRGGLFMWPLLACSVIGLGVTIERLLAMNRATGNARDLISKVLQSVDAEGVPAALRICVADRSPTARILHAGLARARDGAARVERAIETAGSVEVAFLQRGLLWLATVANIAPLLGFLGTVSGMIDAFSTVAGADQISARLVAGGIQKALITTEAGLLIAIPMQTIHNYFVGRIDRFVTRVEEGSLDLIAALEDAKLPAQPDPRAGN